MKFPMFIPLTKVDAAQRLVYGSFDETPDRAGEVCDYATAKPAFQEWSKLMSDASEGKNLGNIRGQHDMKKAAGKLTEISFNDEAKRVDFCAKIVDDAEWLKVEERVYTGFSPGGSYAKRWKDGDHYRYTPKVGELSIVDIPCNPASTFTLVKADGTEEEAEFVLGKAYEPGNDATKARAEDMAKAAGGTTFKDHVVQARADLIAENAADALAKMAGEQGDVEADPQTAVDVVDPVAALEASFAKADAALISSDAPVSVMLAYAAAMTGTLVKCDTALAITPPSPEAIALIGSDLVKSIEAVAAIRAIAEPILAKGMYSLSDAVCSLQSFAWIARDVVDEASWEADGSALPQMAVNIVNSLKAFLIAMVEEEVSEMLARLATDAGDGVALVIEGDGMELAAAITDLVKANAPLMEKAGARNAKADATRIQTIHDKACELGAGCAGEVVEKAATLEAENDRLTKTIEGALPRFEALNEAVETMRAERDADRDAMTKMAEQIETLGGQPAPTKVQLAVEKAADNGSLEKAADAPAAGSIEEANALPPAERQRALEQVALNARR